MNQVNFIVTKIYYIFGLKISLLVLKFLKISFQISLNKTLQTIHTQLKLFIYIYTGKVLSSKYFLIKVNKSDVFYT